jgi:hypothetical protein
LSVASSGVGVERLFNSSRDVCHYRRARLHPATIQAIMLVMCTNKFTLKEEFERRKKGYYKDDDESSDSDLDVDASVTEVQQRPIYISDTESIYDEEDIGTTVDFSIDDLSDGLLLPQPTGEVIRGHDSVSRKSGRTSYNQGQYKT